MRRFALLLGLVAASSAHAWDAVGHRAIALAAYQRLTPTAKAAVDRILRSHPGYAKSEADFKSFDMAATWPDAVRRSKDDHPTWHYIDLPVNHGETGPEPDSTNAATMLPKMIEALKTGSDADRAVALSWVEHLVGDIHQPLHCVSLFDKDHLPPAGDKGGNGFTFLSSKGAAQKLHSYWDRSLELSHSKDPEVIAKALAAVKVSYAPGDDFKAWAEEGRKIAENEVYRASSGGTWLTQDVELPAGYAERAEKIAQERAAIAADRLAEVLNKALG